MVNSSSAAPPFGGQVNIDENNITDYDEYSQVYKTIDWLIVLSSLCGLVGNGVVIWLLSFCMKRNAFTTYILNLAVADFGTLLSLSVKVILSNIISNYSFHLPVELIYFTYNASLYFLTAISLERCLCVLFPILYRCHRPERSSAVVSVVLWIISALLSGTLWVFYGYRSIEIHFKLLKFIFTTSLLIFTPIMVASTLIMSIKICRSSKRRHPPRLYVTILVTLLFFITFAVPLSAVHFVFLNSYHFDYLEFQCSYLFASLNSIINPFIYYLVGRDWKKIREPLKAVLKRAFRDEATCQSRT